MDKVIISIIGTTTLGKTSLVKLLLLKEYLQNKFIAYHKPHVENLDLMTIQELSELLTRKFLLDWSLFYKIQYMVHTKSDLDKFLSSDSTCAIATIGTGDIEPIREYLASKKANCALKVVCLRLDGRSPEFEKIAL